VAWGFEPTHFPNIKKLCFDFLFDAFFMVVPKDLTTILSTSFFDTFFKVVPKDPTTTPCIVLGVRSAIGLSDSSCYAPLALGLLPFLAGVKMDGA
jgi:hypothetical protein